MTDDIGSRGIVVKLHMHAIALFIIYKQRLNIHMHDNDWQGMLLLAECKRTLVSPLILWHYGLNMLDECVRNAAIVFCSLQATPTSLVF